MARDHRYVHDCASVLHSKYFHSFMDSLQHWNVPLYRHGFISLNCTRGISTVFFRISTPVTSQRADLVRRPPHVESTLKPMVGTLVTISPDSELRLRSGRATAGEPSSTCSLTSDKIVSDAEERVRRLCRVHIHVEPLAQTRIAHFLPTKGHPLVVVASIHALPKNGWRPFLNEDPCSLLAAAVLPCGLLPAVGYAPSHPL